MNNTLLDFLYGFANVSHIRNYSVNIKTINYFKISNKNQILIYHTGILFFCTNNFRKNKLNI